MGPKLCHQSPATMDIRHNYDYAVDSSKGKITSASVTILAQASTGYQAACLTSLLSTPQHARFLSQLELMAMNKMLLHGLAAATGGALCQACCCEGMIGISRVGFVAHRRCVVLIQQIYRLYTGVAREENQANGSKKKSRWLRSD